MGILTISGLVLAMFILAVTPGPGVFAVIASSLAAGFRKSVGLILGIVLGDTIFLMFSIFGLAVVAEKMGEFFIIVKYCGSFYLIYLGIRIIISKESGHTEKESSGGTFLSGLFITLSNPKVILFYCGFLPAFMDLNSLKLTDIVIVTFIIVSVLSSVLLFYSYLAGSARRMIKNRRSVRILNRVAGSVMIGSGVALAAKS